MLHHRHRLVLASASPRRQDLLRQAGVFFNVDVADIDEWDHTSHPQLTPAEIVLANAQRKAEAVAQRHPSSLILAADTTVVCQQCFLGKPADPADAVAMLEFLSGKTHEVLTGVAWLRKNDHLNETHVARTLVTFRQLDRSIIDTYLGLVNVMDKAGAYGYQEHGELIVDHIQGSASNVIGLPMEIVLQWLSQLQ